MAKSRTIDTQLWRVTLTRSASSRRGQIWSVSAVLRFIKKKALQQKPSSILSEPYCATARHGSPSRPPCRRVTLKAACPESHSWKPRSLRQQQLYVAEFFHKTTSASSTNLNSIFHKPNLLMSDEQTFSHPQMTSPCGRNFFKTKLMHPFLFVCDV